MTGVNCVNKSGSAFQWGGVGFFQQRLAQRVCMFSGLKSGITEES